jgi:dUTP pyrophosphatase
MKIKIVNNSKHSVPEYKTISSAGMDIYANLDNPVILGPLQRELIPTGLYIELPEGFEAQIRPRSGLCIKNGITVLNSPGTIDADYRGEIGIIVINLSDKEYTINDGERLCQMVIAKHERIEWNIVSELTETNRGSGGFGHTGIKK